MKILSDTKLKLGAYVVNGLPKPGGIGTNISGCCLLSCPSNMDNGTLSDTLTFDNHRVLFLDVDLLDIVQSYDDIKRIW